MLSRFLLPGALGLMGVLGYNPFNIMVADIDEPVNGGQVKADWGTNDNFQDIHGASFIEVSPGMTAQDLIDAVNFKKVDRAAWLKKFNDDIVPRKDSIPTYKYSWNRDDGGRMFHEMAESRKTGTADLFEYAMFAGEVLDPRITLRAAGIGSNAKVFLRRAKNVIGGNPFTVKSLTFKIGSSVSPVDVVWAQCTDCKTETVTFFDKEPPLNVMMAIALKTGMAVDQVKLRYTIHGQKFELGVDTLLFSEANQEAPIEADFIYEATKGNQVALVALGGSRTTYKGWYYVENKDGSRYPNQIVASPFPMVTNAVVADPKENCECLGEHKYRHVNHLIPRKLRMVDFGLECAAHDNDLKYCQEEKLDKGNRKCWCPLKWCYTDPNCGVPSRQFKGLFYSYNYCGEQELDCYTADEEGGIEGAELEEMVVEDIWEFTSLQRFLKAVLTKINEEFDPYNRG